jgi:BirA family biotin operon repressor/biotin-[acetyl-CoA-carboxylase] ligase
LRDYILAQLSQGAGTYISGQTLANELHISKVAVWKHIEALKGLGYDIVAVRNKGYALRPSPYGFHADTVRSSLRTQFVGQNLVYYPQVASTSDTLRRLALQKELPEGYTVVAGSQEVGKGRKGSAWESPPGGLWFSCYFRPELPAAQMPLFSVVFSVAVQVAVQAATGISLSLQWPNDLYYRDAKICGLLLEFQGEMERTDYLILGAGLYLNRGQGGGHVTLGDLTGADYDLNRLLLTLLSQLEAEYLDFRAGGFPEQLARYKRGLRHWGKNLSVSSAGQKFTGRNTDVSEQGFLILEAPDHTRRVLVSGDIDFIEETE